MTQTLSFEDAADGRTRECRTIVSAELILAMQCGDPAVRPARFALHDFDEIRIGRGSERRTVRSIENGRRCLRVQVPDGFMSSNHIRVISHEDGWYAEDCGSKNGCLRNEARIDRGVLVDGDVLTVGSTLFLFRAGSEVPVGEPVLDLGGIPDARASLATLNTRLAMDFATLARVAKTALPVLVLGETGTGKELAAHAVHTLSGRTGEFVAINCGSLPVTLVPSELFGARKGAYSGSSENRLGLVRRADRGTLFLDEIAELPLDAQAALLRALQSGEVVPVGSDSAVTTNVRVVAATHQDLHALVVAGRFREDLYARLSRHTLRLPPLRARREDIGLLIGTMLGRAGHQGARLTPAAARMLFAYDWPRNIRELDLTLRAALAIADGAPIAPQHLPDTLRAAPGSTVETQAEADPERSVEDRFRRALEAHGANVSALARVLGTSRSQVRRIAQRLGVDLSALR